MKYMMTNVCKKCSALFTILLMSLNAMAQGGSTSTHSSTTVNTQEGVNPDPTAWYSNPMVWIAGAAVLLLIIIIVAASRKRTVSNTEVSRTTTTTTTVRED